MPFNNPIRAVFDRIILRTLTTEVGAIADKARKNASWSKKIPGAIEVGKAEKIEGGYQADIIINAKTDAGKVAVAFEYGSGLHRTRGTPALYPIRAKNAPELHFWWEKRKKWFVGVELPFGHPGVAPRPFLKPAIDEQRQAFRSKILAAFIEGYRVSVPKVTIIDAKK